MPIFNDYQPVKADITFVANSLTIQFSDDPSFTRSESVVLDLMQRSIGIIFSHGYHHIGNVPANISSKELETMTTATLCGLGEMGRQITLHAPVKRAH